MRGSTTQLPGRGIRPPSLSADEIRNRLSGTDTLDALLDRLTDEMVQALGWREWCDLTDVVLTFGDDIAADAGDHWEVISWDDTRAVVLVLDASNRRQVEVWCRP